MLTVVVPLVAPIERVVAAPPRFNVVAVVLKRLPVVALVVTFPPVVTRSVPAVSVVPEVTPAVVTRESIVKAPLVMSCPLSVKSPSIATSCLKAESIFTVKLGVPVAA